MCAVAIITNRLQILIIINYLVKIQRNPWWMRGSPMMEGNLYGEGKALIMREMPWGEGKSLCWENPLQWEKSLRVRGNLYGEGKSLTMREIPWSKVRGNLYVKGKSLWWGWNLYGEGKSLTIRGDPLWRDIAPN